MYVQETLSFFFLPFLSFLLSFKKFLTIHFQLKEQHCVNIEQEMPWFNSNTLFVSASLFCLPLLVLCFVLSLPFLTFAIGKKNYHTKKKHKFIYHVLFTQYHYILLHGLHITLWLKPTPSSTCLIIPLVLSRSILRFLKLSLDGLLTCL